MLEVLIVVGAAIIIQLVWPNVLGLDTAVIFGYLVPLAVFGKVFNRERAVATFCTIVLIYIFVFKLIIPLFIYYIFPGLPEIGDVVVEFTGNTFVLLVLSCAFASPLIVENEKIRWAIWFDAIILVFLVYAHSDPGIDAFLAPLYWYFNPGMLMMLVTFLTLLMLFIEFVTGAGED